MDSSVTFNTETDAKNEAPKSTSVRDQINMSSFVPKGAICIMVGDISFPIQVELLQKHPQTFLGSIFSQPGVMLPNDDGDFELNIDVQPAVFEILLDYYKVNNIVCPSNIQLHDLQEACDLFLIPYAGNKIKPDDLGKLFKYMNRHTARIEFEHFFKELLRPMISSMAENGEYDVHVIVLMENDVLDLDFNERPGYLAHLNCEAVYSTQLWRFMKFFGNSKVIREVAKMHCIDFVTSGCEGFPIYNHTNVGDGESPEYLYFRRPFIHMSWTELDEYYE